LATERELRPTSGPPRVGRGFGRPESPSGVLKRQRSGARAGWPDAVTSPADVNRLPSGWMSMSAWRHVHPWWGPPNAWVPAVRPHAATALRSQPWPGTCLARFPRYRQPYRASPRQRLAPRQRRRERLGSDVRGARYGTQRDVASQLKRPHGHRLDAVDGAEEHPGNHAPANRPNPGPLPGPAAVRTPCHHPRAVASPSPGRLDSPFDPGDDVERDAAVTRMSPIVIE
jgi:hypothetical protein